MSRNCAPLSLAFGPTSFTHPSPDWRLALILSNLTPVQERKDKEAYKSESALGRMFDAVSGKLEQVAADAARGTSASGAGAVAG